jgi:hypothetical protein
MQLVWRSEACISASLSHATGSQFYTFFSWYALRTFAVNCWGFRKAGDFSILACLLDELDQVRDCRSESNGVFQCVSWCINRLQRSWGYKNCKSCSKERTFSENFPEISEPQNSSFKVRMPICFEWIFVLFVTLILEYSKISRSYRFALTLSESVNKFYIWAVTTECFLYFFPEIMSQIWGRRYGVLCRRCRRYWGSRVADEWIFI